MKYNVSEITNSEGRAYQKAIYSLPYEFRQFLKPSSAAEGSFFYVDLSSAELTLAAHFYHDEVLYQDIMEGKFWSMWTSYASKADIKKCLYCMAYSASNVTFPASVPANLFEDFTSRYNVWFQGVLRTKYVYERYGKEPFVNKYRNWVTNALIDIPNPSEHHATFKLLNFRVQQSLSSYFQVLCNEFCKTEGVVPYCLNFDSLLATWSGHSKAQFLAEFGKVQERLVKEGKLPCVIPFKGSEGSNFAEAQGWEGSDML